MWSRRRAPWPVLLFLILALGHLWPLSMAPWRLALHHNADTMVSEWLVSWPAHALGRGSLQLFDTNIFWPEPQTLTYGDPVLVPALLAAPLRWSGASPVLAFNLVTLLGLVATATACGAVARRWIGGPEAVLAGLLGAFNVHLLTRLPHLPATHLWGVPLALLCADALVESPSWRRAGALALVVAASAATSMYTLTLVCLVVGIVGSVALVTPRPGERGGNQVVTRGRGARGERRAATPWTILQLAGALVAGLGLAWPVLLPYLRFARAGHERPLEVVAQFSATPSGYLSTPAWLHAWWSSAFFTSEVNALFPGVTAVTLGVVGLVHLGRGSTADRRRALTLLTLLIVGLVLSLGTHTPLYPLLHEWVAPFRGVRVPARFGYLALLAIAVAAAAGLQAGLGRVAGPPRHPRLRPLLIASAILLATMEAWQGPQPVVAFAGLPRIYRQLPSAPATVRLVEVPFYPPDAVHENAEYVLNSTLHWQPLLNGYSGFTPDSYRRRTQTIWFFPESWAMDAIVAEGATHVMVHLARFGAERPSVERAIAVEPRLELVAADPAGRRLYRVRVPR